jgi:hypothetical protein
MFIVCPILRTPRESEMSLSTQVKESIHQASACLRDALAFAARSEHPITVSSISDLLCRLESLEQMDELMQQFANRDENSKGIKRS